MSVTLTTTTRVSSDTTGMLLKPCSSMRATASASSALGATVDRSRRHHLADCARRFGGVRVDRTHVGARIVDVPAAQQIGAADHADQAAEESTTEGR
jgi:hypothetical protein